MASKPDVRVSAFLARDRLYVLTLVLADDVSLFFSYPPSALKSSCLMQSSLRHSLLANEVRLILGVNAIRLVILRGCLLCLSQLIRCLDLRRTEPPQAEWRVTLLVM